MLCFIIIMINFNQLINNQFPYREFNIHYRFVTYQITIMLSLQVPVHAREPGFSISAWIQRTRYHERQIGTDERLVPVQRKGAIRVNSQSLWQPPNFSNIFRLELFIRLARSIEKKKNDFYNANIPCDLWLSYEIVEKCKNTRFNPRMTSIKRIIHIDSSISFFFVIY